MLFMSVFFLFLDRGVGLRLGQVVQRTIPRHAPRRGSNRVQTLQVRWDADRTSYISANTYHASPGSDQGAFAAGTSAGDKLAVERVDGLAEDVVIRVGHLWVSCH